jgi:hypothetical protein
MYRFQEGCYLAKSQILNVVIVGLSAGVLLVLISLIDFILGVAVLQNMGLLGVDIVLEALIFTASVFLVAVAGVLAENRVYKNSSKWASKVPPSAITGVIIGAMAAIGWLSVALVERAVYGSAWIYSTMIMAWPLLYSLVINALGHGFVSVIFYTLLLCIAYALITIIGGRVLRAYVNELHKKDDT